MLRIFARQKEIQRLQKIIEDLEDVITTVRRVHIHLFPLYQSKFAKNHFDSSDGAAMYFYTFCGDQLNTGAIRRQL